MNEVLANEIEHYIERIMENCHLIDGCLTTGTGFNDDGESLEEISNAAFARISKCANKALEEIKKYDK